ncbi:DUF1223 domain-containing protein [Devosia aquimaris]|uniref:DUF1223 domain-containing protein n=1 Tax=Devosia aquimaris TaxID=2866214 RepID=UPI001CD149B1|nr:DUF1223 domain-containing protein [Devosia sp. CJK-A8-3]
MIFRPAVSALLGTLLVALSLALPASADSLRVQPKAVVELFTSQGCSSCPPADALLTSLSERGDVLALAYHVDYWDYVGWKDTFGSPAYSDRQRAYAQSWGSSRIYTPQMVVNGAIGVVGSRRNEVNGAIDRAQLPLDVAVTQDRNMLKVSIPADTALNDAVVWLVTYINRADVDIAEGNNAGKSMVYTQVVTGRQALGLWESNSGASLKLPIPEMLADTSNGIAVIVQQEHNGLPGPILGAAAFER